MAVRYATKFCLAGCVNDWGEAQRYLDEDDMTQFVDSDIRPLLIEVRWTLSHRDSGYVVVDAHEELSQEILDRLSSWISGQNSDGLGEGFEQQDFAWDTGFEPDDENYDPYDGCMCSFDWRTNNYKLVRFEDMDEYDRKDLVNDIGYLEN